MRFLKAFEKNDDLKLARLAANGDASALEAIYARSQHFEE